MFHWRGESIMPHGEENTRAFLLASLCRLNPKHTPSSLSSADNLPYSLGQARRTLIACQCLWSSPVQSAACDSSGQSEKPCTWVADYYYATKYVAVDHKPSGFNVLKASWHAKLCNGGVTSPWNHRQCRIYLIGCHVCCLTIHSWL